MDPVIAVDHSYADSNPANSELMQLAGTDISQDHRARLEESVAARYLPIARRLASRFTRTGAELDDLVQVACLALVKAIRRFSPERGDFERYAHATINGELKKYLRDQCWSVRPPRRVQELHSQVGIATESLAQTKGHLPSVDEVAGILGSDSSAVREAMTVRTCFRAISLDQPIDPSGRVLGDTLSGECSEFSSIDDISELVDIVADLNPHEKQMLWLRFVDGRSQREIADLLGMSQMMVSRRIGVLVSNLRERARAFQVA